MSNGQSMEENYTPNPKRQKLYRELEILNEELIRLGVSDQARILRMRLFAESSKSIDATAELHGVRLTDGIDDNTWNHRWCATFRNRYLGTYDSPREAHEAYRAAHIQHFGVRSRYHPKYEEPALMLDEDLPKGVRLTASGRYQARIRIGNRTKCLNSWPTAEQAYAEYRAAHIAHHGEKSCHFNHVVKEQEAAHA